MFGAEALLKGVCIRQDSPKSDELVTIHEQTQAIHSGQEIRETILDFLVHP